MNGVYALIIKVKKRFSTRIGSLGDVTFNPGAFVYVGSGQNNLESRIKRHLLKYKKIHWYIDYLTSSEYVKTKNVIYAQINSRTIECELAQKIQKINDCKPVIGFGNTDCKAGCHSHLFEMSHDNGYASLDIRKSFGQLGLNSAKIVNHEDMF